MSHHHHQERYEVSLYIYDLSKGMARSLSTLFLGREIPAIWHTAIVVYDREYFFGGRGIESCIAGSSQLGEPDQILALGHTEVSYNLFLEYLFSMGESTFSPSSYQIFENNCNNFSNEIALFLTGNGIPDEILNLPNDFLSTPLGQTLQQYLNTLTIRPKGSGVRFYNPDVCEDNNNNNNHPKQISTDSSISTTISKSVSDHNNEIPTSTSSQNKLKMSDDQLVENFPNNNGENINNDDDDDGDDKAIGDKFTTSTSRRSYKYEDPPIVFKDIDGLAAIRKVEEMVFTMLNPQQQQCLKEIDEYLQSESGAWAIGDEHLDLIAYLLNGGDGKFAPNVTLLTLEVLQAASLKEDVVLILHQDRKDHRIMSYINRIENLTLAEQEEIVKLLCNLCGQPSTIDWLMYISEWCEENGHPNSNSRVTIRAAVHTLLNDQLTTLQRNGVYLIYNLSLKEVFEDVSIELATAVLQYMHSDLPDDQALLSLTAITRFIEISPTDVPALIKMLGPDLNKYKGKNEKMDKLLAMIDEKVAKLPSFS
ncbi:uncharacterized protein LOC124497125 isoform X2 [Dermatophagoides farinae]|uniref:Desumoylating isopeptidase 1 n=1 Tax=Dermatophagoides farinae TaxID=6954 RepID=A0A922HSE6_DERFA|nr:Desumoylating isopeptidase 1 [Dermatophagoides farinae]